MGAVYEWQQPVRFVCDPDHDLDTGMFKGIFIIVVLKCNPRRSGLPQ